MSEWAVEDEPEVLKFVPDHFKTKRMRKWAVEGEPEALEFIPDHFKTKKMCDRAVEDEPDTLEFIPDYLKTQKNCDKAVKSDPYSLLFVSDWFVTQKQLKIWHDDDEYCDGKFIVKWYKRYQKRKGQKASIKEELSPIAWHPSRCWDLRVSEDEKKETEKLWA